MTFNTFKINNLTNKIILGINPAVFDFAHFDLWAKPLGLLNVLGQLRRQGNQVHLLDCVAEARTKELTHGRWAVSRQKVPTPLSLAAVERPYYRFGLGPEEISAKLQKLPKPDIILVTSIMTYWYPGVFESISVLKKFYPDVPIILGGLYARLCSEHARQSGADFLCLTNDFPPGLSPAMDLYENPGYAILNTSSGCPLACQYCASSILTPQFYPRSPSDIVADLRQQLSWAPSKNVAFYDDALLWQKEKRFYPLAEELCAFGELKFHVPNGLAVSMLDEKCARIMFDLGFTSLRLSLEGLDDYTLALSATKLKAAQYQKVVETLREIGFKRENLGTYVLVGLPGQNLKDVLRTIEFVVESGAIGKLCEFSPVPGTPLFKKAAEITPEILSEPLWHNNTIYLTHLLKQVSTTELQSLKTLGRTKVKIAD